MLKTIDLFAGAGGLSFGFESTNEFIIVAAAENNENARLTYIANHKDHEDITMIKDVRGYDFSKLAKQKKGIDIVIGGPPCQGFSNANRQKNHIVSMNNSLVKEFFRAVREIKPKAFVMENVAMLASDTHKFYDSLIDHDEVVDLGIQMKDDELVLADGEYNGFKLLEILTNSKQEDYMVSDSLFQLLSVLYKDRNNSDRLTKYLKKNSRRVKEEINLFKESSIYQIDILDQVVRSLESGFEEKLNFVDLGEYVKFQKAFRLKKELDDNKIIYTLIQDEKNNKIKARVRSYSVAEYVEMIVKEQYYTSCEVLNSLWFGVPQERRRFIMIGVKKSLCAKEDVKISVPSNFDIVTVKDAIFDLKSYKVVEDTEKDEAQPYKNTKRISSYAEKMRRNSKGVKNHIVPQTRDKALERFKSLKEGENFHKLDSRLKSNYSNPERTQNSVYLRLDSSKPSGTVINVRKSMWIHPTLDRAISVREAARLQSFPDEFEFVGTKDSQYQQVGNAVPPLLAQGIAEELLRILMKKKSKNN